MGVCIFSQTPGQFRRAQQAAITHRVDKQNRSLPVHPTLDQSVLRRVADEVKVVAVRLPRDNRTEIRFAQRFGGGEHVENQLRLAPDVRPEPAVQIRLAREAGDFFERPEREAGTVGFRAEAAEEILFGKRLAELPGDLELSGPSERGDDVSAVAQPV